ncbi:ABC transporter permease [Planctomicrobium sp. SH668]|uniref:ABC transporter permease n=1 Tax=Planctomicrobium sp. SH668 TaxID=3448126 RepID=UPI003F5BDCDA
MVAFFVRRISLAFLTLVMITFIVYGMIRSMPGSPVAQEMAMMDPGKQISEADKQRILKTYGLDKPWYQSYAIWIGNLAKGDLGTSFSRKSPVIDLIAERIFPTLLLSLSSLALTYVLSIPIGLYSTARSGKTDERVIATVLYMLYSFPSYVAALYLQLWLCVHLELLPLFGMTSDDHASMSNAGKAWDILQHAFLPITCYTYGSLAYYSRFIKANMNEVARQDFIRTAKAKGLGPVRVLLVHAFRNTLIPFVTQIGLMLPALFSGAIIIERIFTWPGMGGLFFQSIREHDYPTIMGLTLMFSVLTLVGQLLADVLYAVVDPRVRLETR